jgi:hypothetical protein
MHIWTRSLSSNVAYVLGSSASPVAGSLVRLAYRFRISRMDRRLNALQTLHARTSDSRLARQCAALEFDSLATSRAILTNRLQRLGRPMESEE